MPTSYKKSSQYVASGMHYVWPICKIIYDDQALWEWLLAVSVLQLLDLLLLLCQDVYRGSLVPFAVKARGRETLGIF